MLRDLVPYHRQADPHWCGAAALRMVYASFGVQEEQADIWARITHPVSARARAAGSYRLAQDALERGLDALVLRAREPWPMLERCLQWSIRAILNHRPKPHGSTGHFSVLVHLNANEIVFHDPLAGPEQRLPRAEFVRLWSRQARGADGLVLVAIASPAPYATPCRACSRQVPDEQVCRGCRRPMRVQPASVLACWFADCPARTWDTLFCPNCDLSVYPERRPLSTDKKIE